MRRAGCRAREVLQEAAELGGPTQAGRPGAGARSPPLGAETLSGRRSSSQPALSHCQLRRVKWELERPREPRTEVTHALHDSRTLPAPTQVCSWRRCAAGAGVRLAQVCGRGRCAAGGPLPRPSRPSTRSPELRTCLRGPPRGRDGVRGRGCCRRVSQAQARGFTDSTRRGRTALCTPAHQ